ncbi:MAG: hypothetical protein ACPG5B_16465 [Chitinophagales bacterium]
MSNLQNLIDDFSPENLNVFFRSSMNSFETTDESFDFLFDEKTLENYEDIELRGKANIGLNSDLLIIAAKTTKALNT